MKFEDYYRSQLDEIEPDEQLLAATKKQLHKKQEQAKTGRKPTPHGISRLRYAAPLLALLLLIPAIIPHTPQEAGQTAGSGGPLGAREYTQQVFAPDRDISLASRSDEQHTAADISDGETAPESARLAETETTQNSPKQADNEAVYIKAADSEAGGSAAFDYSAGHSAERSLVTADCSSAAPDTISPTADELANDAAYAVYRDMLPQKLPSGYTLEHTAYDAVAATLLLSWTDGGYEYLDLCIRPYSTERAAANELLFAAAGLAELPEECWSANDEPGKVWGKFALHHGDWLLEYTIKTVDRPAAEAAIFSTPLF